jgi:hypothetical protein
MGYDWGEYAPRGEFLFANRMRHVLPEREQQK